MGMITAMAVFPPVERPPLLLLELELPELAPARPALWVDDELLVPLAAGAVSVDVTVTTTVLPGWPLLDATTETVVWRTSDADAVVDMDEVVAVVDTVVDAAIDDV